METNTKWNVFLVLVASLALTVIVGGIGPSPALGCEWPDGRMTGGGSIFADGTDLAYGGQVGWDGRVTHGFELRCTPRNSDNLQIVDHRTNQSFHLLSLIAANCSDDPNIEPNPPDAGFDTFEGWGYGRCKQPSRPCLVHFIFTDGGERGGCLRDTAYIEVTDADTGELVIGIGTLDPLSMADVDCGNHQAHNQ